MSEEAKIENLQFETAREETRLPKIDEEEMWELRTKIRWKMNQKNRRRRLFGKREKSKRNERERTGNEITERKLKKLINLGPKVKHA